MFSISFHQTVTFGQLDARSCAHGDHSICMMIVVLHGCTFDSHVILDLSYHHFEDMLVCQEIVGSMVEDGADFHVRIYTDITFEF